MDIATVKAAVNLYDLISGDAALRGGPKEYASPCPKCGGTDRFHVHVDKGWFCRKCTGDPADAGSHWHDAIDYLMWRDGCDFVTAYNRLGGDTCISPDERRRMAQERMARQAEQDRQEREQRANKMQTLNQIQPWRVFNDNLDRLGKRHLWHDRGLTDEFIHYFMVGYCPRFEYMRDGTLHTAETLTIPYLTPGVDGMPGLATTMVHRIISAQDGDKYRPHLSGMGKQLFICDQFMPMLGDVLIVEGEIKAMVTWQHVQAGDGVRHTSPLGNIQVVGLAGASLKPDLVPSFFDAERIWLCLDPDAIDQARRIAEMLGAQRCRIIRLPDKIDDMLIDGTLDIDLTEQLMKTARRL